MKVMEKEGSGSDQHKDDPPALNDAAGDVPDQKAKCHITQVLVSSFYRFGCVPILIFYPNLAFHQVETFPQVWAIFGGVTFLLLVTTAIVVVVLTTSFPKTGDASTLVRCICPHQSDK